MSTRRTASSQKKGTVARRKTSSRRGGSRGRRRSSSVFLRYPRLAWWIGGTAVVVLYVFLFYHFFVGPTGFRWRALYGDEVYPEGYEIHGIDISHYQGTINWEKVAKNRYTDIPIQFIFFKATDGNDIVDEKGNVLNIGLRGEALESFVHNYINSTK